MFIVPDNEFIQRFGDTLTDFQLMFFKQFNVKTGSEWERDREGERERGRERVMLEKKHIMFLFN